MKKEFLAVFLLLAIIPSVIAEEKYSFEKAEALKPLIDWNDYSPEAFTKAAQENKPIFLLLTAPSWCYWCQVYESEDYLFHPDMVSEINQNYVPVYVDADRRQDLTRQYLEGGWPSTTILTPSGERIYGHSGPRPVPNMLDNLRRAALFVAAQGFTNQVTYSYEETNPIIPTQSQLDNIRRIFVSSITQAFDPINGGFGSGQKFPQGRALDFALQHYEETRDQQYLTIVTTTLQNQYTKTSELKTNYNLFDPVEGGFHRYGTARDWSPPHYEKMLYDNGRLLKAYVHLQQIQPNNQLAKEVVRKTDQYIQENWYDPTNGGFYGNTDVAGEDAYYAENPRPLPKARVEKTKYTDWNADAILAYLYFWEQTNDEQYKIIAQSSLDFFIEKMMSENGAYHYYSENREKGVRGSLVDNANLLLALVEGYDTLQEGRYLSNAKTIADYALDNLYDWNSGGFFERNSPDLELYAPGQHVNLRKPTVENGIMSYALVKLYQNTQDMLYLSAALKSLGASMESMQILDRGYYHAKAAQEILENDLLEEYRPAEIKSKEKEKQENFWLTPLLENQQPFEPSVQGIETISGPIFVLIIISLLAGLISFISPCTLPIMPAYIAYTLKTPKQNLRAITLFFFLGLSIVFTLLGMSATFIGNILRSNIEIFTQIAGIAIILIGIAILFEKGFSGLKIKSKKPTTYFSSFFFGAIFGLSWTPCVGPILVAILLLASTAGSVLQGGTLLFSYAIGLAIPLILISAYIEKINKKSRLWKIIQGKEVKILNKKIHSNTLISGVLFMVLGYLIFSGVLFSFNQYIAASSFQKVIFAVEEFLLGLM